MAKILIVGHSDSDYQIIEKLLHEVGMQPAHLSKREQMSAQEINTALLKAHPSTPGAKALLLGDKIANRQLAVNTVWNGLAMDLFLGNIEQSLWGWADSQALPLLNYWQEMDDSVHFALVYDQPHSVLTRQPNLLNHEEITQKLQDWLAYNESLLHFYSRNKDRCLLVHSQQAKLSAASYIQQVQRHIEAPWANTTLPESSMPPAANKASNSSITVHKSDNTESNHLTHFLADFMVKSHPAVMNLYQELQASANLPLHESAHLHADSQTAALAWEAMIEQHHTLNQQATALEQQSTQLSNIQQESDLLLSQLHATQEALESIHLTHKSTEVLLNSALQEKNQQAARHKQAHDEAGKKISLLEQERQNILNQNKQLQQTNQTDSATIKKLENAQATLTQEKNHLEKLKSNLEQAQASALKEKANQLTTAENDNQQLLSQLHHVQEELERLFLENQRLSAHPVYYGAAERVRNQLDYRLGAAMIQNSRNLSGWLNMPFALLKERRKASPNETALPAVSEYQDAYEAEKMHRHLSYQLGQTLLKHSRNPFLWLTAPWALSKTVKEFRKQTKAAKK